MRGGHINESTGGALALSGRTGAFRFYLFPPDISFI